MALVVGPETSIEEIEAEIARLNGDAHTLTQMGCDDSDMYDKTHRRISDLLTQREVKLRQAVTHG